MNHFSISDLDFFDAELSDRSSSVTGGTDALKLLASLDGLKEKIMAQAKDEKSTKPVITIRESEIKGSVGQFVSVS